MALKNSSESTFWAFFFQNTGQAVLGLQLFKNLDFWTPP